jgi:hypothetical protein
MGELNADCGILSPHKGNVIAFGAAINTNNINSLNEGSPASKRIASNCVDFGGISASLPVRSLRPQPACRAEKDRS